MKIILLLAAIALTSCASTSDSQTRWNEMRVDIALRHKYERYSCGHRGLEGYSKDTVYRFSRRASVSAKPEEPITRAAQIQTVQQSEAVRELEGKIAVLEEALKSNVAATNANQALIVDQIRSLKAQLDSQQAKPAPPAPPLASGIHIPGT
jgi:hypothetical protein